VTTREFERSVGEALARLAHPRRGETIVLSVSGGADSMALLGALHAFNERSGSGWRLHVAHLNHRLRGAESDADARFVRAAAADRGLPSTIGSRRRALRAARLRSASRRSLREPVTLEEAARDARYDFLRRVARRTGAVAVVTAHHAGDQAETVLHRILRGTGLAGLAGIPAVRPLDPGGRVRVVRPLLNRSRAEAVDYLRARGLAWRDDATNAALDRTRNRIRHGLLPLIRRDINPRADAALTRLALVARLTADFVDRSAREALAALTRRSTARSRTLDAPAMAAHPLILRAAAILHVLRGLRAGLGRVRLEHLLDAAALADRGRGGRQIELPGASSRGGAGRRYGSGGARPRAAASEEWVVWSAAAGRRDPLAAARGPPPDRRPSRESDERWTCRLIVDPGDARSPACC